MRERLEVWLQGVHVGNLERKRQSDLRIKLHYTAEALQRWPGNAPLVSCSLPLRDRPADVVPFLRGVLPEGNALSAVAARVGASVNDTWGLLEHFGRDIAGALVIAGEAPDETRFGLERYDDESLGDEVAALELHPLGVRDDSELSLAGLQNKLLLVRDGDAWARPLRGRPSTHILKAEDRRYPGMAQAEADCLKLAQELGLTPVTTVFLETGGIASLITERYDRAVADDGVVDRIHQEDLCQATGVDGAADRGRRRYQRRGGRGPGYREAAGLLDRYADDPVAELTRLVEALAFTVAIGNADAHAKNWAFLHDTPTTIRLAPLYDTVPTVLWPRLTQESALSIHGRFDLRRITIADISDEAASWPLERRRAEATATAALERLLGSVETIEGEQLAGIVTRRCRQLLAGTGAGDGS